MAFKNPTYRGPEVMIQLKRSTNTPWQVRSIRNGYLISNAQYRERYQPNRMLDPLEADSMINPATKTQLSERDLRNLHSQSSRKTSGALDAPNSKYVSMTSSDTQTGWGEGQPPTLFKFEIWRSDVWKGKHDISRDPALSRYLATLAGKTPEEREAFSRAQTPADWDRGIEFEWLALGGTKVYNVKESSDDGQTWTNSKPTVDKIDFWWESLERKPSA